MKRFLVLLILVPAIVSAQTSFLFNKNLSLRMMNDPDVARLQQVLKNLGFYSGDITGNFFTQTQQAVKVFQEAYGINQTGFVGPTTRSMIAVLFGATSNSQPKVTTTANTNAQQSLVQTSSYDLKIYDKVSSLGSVNIRNSPSLASNVLRVTFDGEKGTIVGGPIRSEENYIWWNVKFDQGSSGWVAGKFLKPTQDTQFVSTTNTSNISSQTSATQPKTYSFQSNSTNQNLPTANPSVYQPSTQTSASTSTQTSSGATGPGPTIDFSFSSSRLNFTLRTNDPNFKSTGTFEATVPNPNNYGKTSIYDPRNGPFVTWSATYQGQEDYPMYCRGSGPMFDNLFGSYTGGSVPVHFPMLPNDPNFMTEFVPSGYSNHNFYLPSFPSGTNTLTCHAFVNGRVPNAPTVSSTISFTINTKIECKVVSNGSGILGHAFDPVPNDPPGCVVVGQ